MATKSTTPFRCPNCKKPVERSTEDFPFCSPRCRVIDLGKWASEDYRIAGEPTFIPDQLADDERY